MYKKNIHYAPELEEAVIGACLLERSAIGRLYGLITEETFYTDSYKLVFSTILKMFEDNEPVDLMTVFLKMTGQGIADINGSNTAYFLTHTTIKISSTANIEYYCYLLKQMWVKREIIRLTTSGINPDKNTREQINNLHTELQRIQGTEIKKEWVDMSELMMSLIQHQDEIKLNGDKSVTTGFKEIDRENGGFYSGNMIVIGARPSVGKSALSGKMAIAMARAKNKVGIISLEMNNNEIAARLASLESDIEFWRIHRNLMVDEDQKQFFYKQVDQKLINLPIFISDKTKVNINEIRSKAIKLKSKEGLNILIIDYLQLVDSTGENRNYNREQEVSRISRGIKLMAMELQIPVIVLCQLNRQITGRTGENRKPQLSDLRESGAIEQDADVVGFLHRDWMSGIAANDDGSSTEFEADLIFRKWRNGKLVQLKLGFDPPKMKFYEKEDTPGANFRPVNLSEVKEDPF